MAARAVTIASSSSAQGAQPHPQMDRGLLEAAKIGDARSMKEMATQNPTILLGATPHGSTCLHISSINGHERFCKDVLSLNQSLLEVVNSDGETPLLVAVTSGHSSLASMLLGRCRDLGLSDAIMRQDKNGCNALHHAIRSGRRDLALELITAEPALSRGVNKYGESPMFIAVMRDLTDVFRKLLEIEGSADVGVSGYNALHAAVRSGNPVIAKELLEKRPWLAREEQKDKHTPMHLAAVWGKTEMLRVFLQHDPSLGCALLRRCWSDMSPYSRVSRSCGVRSICRRVTAAS